MEDMEKAGIDPNFGRLPQIACSLDERGVRAVGEEIMFAVPGGLIASVQIGPLSSLFSGTREPPADVSPEAGSPYALMFAMLELAAWRYCRTAQVAETDQEFERIYRQLRRRPDGTDPNRVFSHIQAAARVYVACTETSLAEFEAVVQRLSKSARTFSRGHASRNYLGVLDGQFGRMG